MPLLLKLISYASLRFCDQDHVRPHIYVLIFSEKGDAKSMLQN